MNNGPVGCDEVRMRLIELAYDDFDDARPPAAVRAELERHVAQCDGCREALGDLAWTRDLVAKAAASQMGGTRALRAGQIQREIVTRVERGQRRWRRLAWLASAAALLVCVWSASRLRVEVHQSHVVLAWGGATGGGATGGGPTGADATGGGAGNLPTFDVEQVAGGDEQSLRQSLAAHQRRLVEINRLLDLMVTELNRNSARIETAATAFSRRIDAVERQNNERWKAVGRGFHDWYLKHGLAQASSPPADF
jgi:hypothetical protein